MVKEALKSSDLEARQDEVSLPKIQRIVEALLRGEKMPPIKVSGKEIIDGNHRNAAYKILGQEALQTEGNSSNLPTKSVKELKVDPVDWGD